MLKIKIDDEGTAIAVRGSLAELSADLVKVLHELRTEIARNDKEDGQIFDTFLKDVFIDLIFAGTDLDKVSDILMDSIVKRMDDGK